MIMNVSSEFWHTERASRTDWSVFILQTCQTDNWIIPLLFVSLSAQRRTKFPLGSAGEFTKKKIILASILSQCVRRYWAHNKAAGQRITIILRCKAWKSTETNCDSWSWSWTRKRWSISISLPSIDVLLAFNAFNMIGQYLNEIWTDESGKEKKK